MIKKNRASKAGLFNPRFSLALLLCSIGSALAVLSLGRPNFSTNAPASSARIASVQLAALDAVMPISVKRPIAATMEWVRSFTDPTTSRRQVAMTAAAGNRISPNAPQALTPLVSETVTPTVSPPVRDLPAISPFTISTGQREEGELSNREPEPSTNPLETDPVVQRTTAPTVGMPAVGASFEGMNNSQACDGCIPPDPNGAVGPNHYVQMVNEHFAIYSKTGALLSSPKTINSLWASTPNSTCATHNNGDPIVIYDQLADRWLLSQFTVQSGSENYAECIAISQTPDPTGAYWLYQFDESADTFHDYPHIGIWPDGYYMTTNLFPNSALLFSTGAGAWAFERPKMLLGQAARYVYFDTTPLATNTYTPGGQLPTSVEGKNPPPAGAPNYFVEVDNTNTANTPPATGLHDEMHIWKFHVDWTTPTNSTFGTGSSVPALKPGFSGLYAGNAGQPNYIVPIADFVPVPCQYASGPSCIPQLVPQGQPPEFLEALGDRLMYRVTYRNFGDHESLLVSHTAQAPADQPDGGARAGVRWYEFRALSTTPTVYQQSTFAPLDPTSLNGPLWRWMGSAAMDHSGNIAVAYSASGPNYFPSLHYAGRLAGDPLNQLTQGEAVLFAGLGIEVAVPDYLQRNRWGDYSNLTVDPTDDCTFWYTNEYINTNTTFDAVSSIDWHTRIGSFKFPQCTSTPVQLNAVVSRKTHGSAGTYDIGLPLAGNPGIECRTGGANGDHTIVFTFAVPVTFATADCGGTPATASSGGNSVIVNCTGVPNAQTIQITVHGVSAAGFSTSDAVAPASFLAGDTNADGSVNSADIAQTKSQSGQSVATANFREDLNTDGSINSADIALVKSKSGTALP